MCSQLLELIPQTETNARENVEDALMGWPSKANVALGRRQFLPSYWLLHSRAERIPRAQRMHARTTCAN